MKKIYIGSDHAGFRLKEMITKWLKKNRIDYEDLGNLTYDINDDYPDYAAKVARKVARERTFGILLCGSAEGMCIAANKIKGVRAVNPSTPLLAKLSREHNNANVICLSGGGTLDPIPGQSLETATKMIKRFLDTPFSTESRHKRRVDKIVKLEK